MYKERKEFISYFSLLLVLYEKIDYERYNEMRYKKIVIILFLDLFIVLVLWDFFFFLVFGKIFLESYKGFKIKIGI